MGARPKKRKRQKKPLHLTPEQVMAITEIPQS